MKGLTALILCINTLIQSSAHWVERSANTYKAPRSTPAPTELVVVDTLVTPKFSSRGRRMGHLRLDWAT